MKLTTSFLILALTGTVLAQAPANKNAAAPAAKPTATAVKPAANGKTAQATPAKPATSAAKPQTPPAKPATAAAKPQTPPAKSATSAMKPATAPAKATAKKTTSNAAKTHNAVAKAPAKPAAAPAEADKKPAEPAASAKNRRDPFLSVVMSRDGPACAGAGKKCIAIDQVMLQGVVRAPSGPIAVVSSGGNKTYFLRENDPVYNGVVVKISPDSIVFRETVMDRLGKTSQREVVKKIHNAPAA